MPLTAIKNISDVKHGATVTSARLPFGASSVNTEFSITPVSMAVKYASPSTPTLHLTFFTTVSSFDISGLIDARRFFSRMSGTALVLPAILISSAGPPGFVISSRRYTGMRMKISSFSAPSSSIAYDEARTSNSSPILMSSISSAALKNAIKKTTAASKSYGDP